MLGESYQKKMDLRSMPKGCECLQTELCVPTFLHNMIEAFILYIMCASLFFVHHLKLGNSCYVHNRVRYHRKYQSNR